MQELEKILEEIEKFKEMYKESALSLIDKGNLPCEYDKSDIESAKMQAISEAITIIRKHMNNGWISVDEKPKKDYETVFAVDKNDYYFVAVYNKYHGFRSNDIGADVDNIVAYCLFDPYRPERSEGE